MPKVKFDVSGSDPDKAASGSFEPPKPGVYKAKIAELKPGFTDNDKTRPRLEVVVEITDKRFLGSRLWDYISFGEASQWKLDQFLQAMGLADKKKRKGTFDTDLLLNKPLKVRVKGETFNEEYRARLNAYISWDGEDDGSDEEADETADEEVEEVEDEVEVEEEAEEVEEEPEEEGYDREGRQTELMGVGDLKDLRKIMNEYGLSKEIKGRAKMIEAILDHEEAAVGEGGEEEEEEPF